MPRAYASEDALRSWATLNPVLMDLEKAEVLKLMRLELLGNKRPRLLNRLHQRFCQLRRGEEWEALQERLTAPKGTSPLPDWLVREEQR
jgi:hypothetical protein